ncbi:uncharacterized protein F5Z01DRAFT_632338 [Emericellopsis atlantica]|uniref:Uncharacterized protein n=1 Tax=Emericellopsis atlantica TaxID=2614577 RepID=A0A9P7ZXF3_9HYPO|nr:uncharacterized protein F5Z01DRAFT_632338 [Emericellopsis atlantica]KAG9259267.1 hypothetical protein F5Z01DRAFT_632338 [Emericellopsis atlantica]
MLEQDETNAKAGAWTEAAKVGTSPIACQYGLRPLGRTSTDRPQLEFLLRIIAVYKDNKPMPWSRINMPGRTQKSLQNQWTKIQKDIAALTDGDPETALKVTPRKRGKKAVGIENGDDDEEDTPTKKKARTPTKAKDKAVKKEVKNEGLTDDEDIIVKKEEDSDMD